MPLKIVMFDGPLAGEVYEVEAIDAKLGERGDFYSPDYTQRHYYKLTRAGAEITATFLRSVPLSAEQSVNVIIGAKMAANCKRIFEMITSPADQAALQDNDLIAWQRALLYAHCMLSTQVLKTPEASAAAMLEVMATAGRDWLRRQIIEGAQRN